MNGDLITWNHFQSFQDHKSLISGPYKSVLNNNNENVKNKYSSDLAYAMNIIRTVTEKKGIQWRWKMSEDRSQMTEDREGERRCDIWSQKRQCMSDSKPWKNVCTINIKVNIKMKATDEEKWKEIRYAKLYMKFYTLLVEQ